MKKISIKRLHIIILILGISFIMLSIFHTNLWFDEAYSVAMATKSFVDIWKIGGNDVHPILYYWMLKGVSIITNQSILAYRIFSVIPIILLGNIGFTHISKDFGEKVGLFFTFITFFIPMSAVYANQIRMYSWAIYILTLFFVYSYRIYKGEETIKNWFLFGLLSLFSIYIHYYGLMAAGITNLLLLISFIKNKRKQSIISILLIGIVQLICYLPWIIYFINQLEHVAEGFWITLTLQDILKLIGCQLTGRLNIYLGAILSIFIYAYIFFFLYHNIKRIDIKPVIFSIMLYLLVIGSGLAIQVILKTPILYHRYLFVITGLYVFILSYILAHERNKYIISSICIIILMLGIANNIYQIKENYSNHNLKLLNYLKNNIEKQDGIIYNDIENGAIIANNFDNKQYFYNPQNWGVKEAYKVFEPQMQTYTSKNFIDELPNRIWIMDGENEELIEELTNKRNYKIIKFANFKTNYYQEKNYSIKLLEKN